MNVLEKLEAVLFLAGVNKAVVDVLLEPVRKKFPQLDLWWGVYVSLAAGIGITMLTEVNAFSGMMTNEVVGRVFTGVFVGGGAKVIHDALDREPTFLNIRGIQ